MNRMIVFRSDGVERASGVIGDPVVLALHRLDLAGPPDELGYKFELALANHIQAETPVLQRLPGTRVELDGKAQLVGPPHELGVAQEDLVEQGDFGHRRRDSARFPLGGQKVHHSRDVNAVRAARGAGLAPRAEPRRLRPERDLVEAELRRAHYLIGREIEMFGNRAAGGAFDALVTRKNVLADFGADFLGQLCFQARGRHDASFSRSDSPCGRGSRPARWVMIGTAFSHSIAIR